MAPGPGPTDRLARGVLCAVLVLGACEKLSSENIQLWKTTMKGPDKLEAALKDKGGEPRLRAEAAVALVDIGRAEAADRIIAELPQGDRLEMMKTLIPAFSAGLKDPSVDKGRDAKDALFSLRQYAPPEEQKQIDALLIAALKDDFRAGRLQGGRHSPEKMLGAIGTAAGGMLADSLGDALPNFLGVAEMLAKIGTSADQERGARYLVSRAGKEKDVPIAMWKAIGVLPSKVGLDFLVAKAEKGSEKDSVMAAQALQQRRDPAALEAALRIAGTPSASKLLRDEMFGVVEKIGGLQARQGLCKIIAEDKVEIVRYRAYEAALAGSGPEAIGPALEAFPAGATYKVDDVADFLVKDVEKLAAGGGKAATRQALVKVLESRAPLARLVAVLGLEKVGGAAEAEAVDKLSGDHASVKGAGEVGKEAARVAAVLRKKA